MQNNEKLILVIVLIFIALLFILALTIFYPGDNSRTGEYSFPSSGESQENTERFVEYIQPEEENEQSIRNIAPTGTEPILIIETRDNAESVQDNGAVAGNVDQKAVADALQSKTPESAVVKAAQAYSTTAVSGAQPIEPNAHEEVAHSVPSPSPSSILANNAHNRPRTPPNTANTALYGSRQYWVQLLSSPNYLTILRLQKGLMRYSVGSIIVPKQIGDQLHMRVRVGPYYEWSEAEKFAQWFRQMRELENSFVAE